MCYFHGNVTNSVFTTVSTFIISILTYSKIVIKKLKTSQSNRGSNSLWCPKVTKARNTFSLKKSLFFTRVLKVRILRIVVFCWFLLYLEIKTPIVKLRKVSCLNPRKLGKYTIFYLRAQSIRIPSSTVTIGITLAKVHRLACLCINRSHENMSLG